MDFDFLVFPSPKCSYNKQKLGDELIFIPKYTISIFKETSSNSQQSFPFDFSQKVLKTQENSKNKFTTTKTKSETTMLFTPRTTMSTSFFQSSRKINVKLEMTNYMSKLNKKDDEEQPLSPLLSNNNFEEKKKKNFEVKKNAKRPSALQELAINEQKKSFFLQNKNDFEENIDINSLSSPRKIIFYRSKETKINNIFKMNSPRCLTSKYKSSTQFFESPSFLKHRQTVHNQTVKPVEIQKIDRYIPCLLLDTSFPTDKILIYFHGNAEDIYLAYELLSYIQRYLKVIFYSF